MPRFPPAPDMAFDSLLAPFVGGIDTRVLQTANRKPSRQSGAYTLYVAVKEIEISKHILANGQQAE